MEQALDQEVAEHYLIRDSIDGEKLRLLLGRFPERGRNRRATCASRMPPLPWKEIDTEKAVEWVNQRLDVTLGPVQRRPWKRFCAPKSSFSPVGPAPGKTTLTRAITTILGAKGVRLSLCSPTGRAAKRLSECTGLEAGKRFTDFSDLTGAEGAFPREGEPAGSGPPHSG